jgi:predicted small lipoprotein YifL
MKVGKIFVVFVAVGLSFFLATCGQRVPLRQPDGALQDSNAY